MSLSDNSGYADMAVESLPSRESWASPAKEANVWAQLRPV